MVDTGTNGSAITPQELSDGGVLDRHALFESVVTHAGDVVLVTGAEPIDAASGGPKVVYVNPAFTRMTGYEAHEILGRTPRILQSPATDRRELDRLRAALLAWRPIEVELLNVRKDGSEFWAQISITPVADRAGHFTHWIAIQREITERKRRELGIKTMLDSTSDLLLVLDDGRVTAASTASRAILGYEPEQVQGRSFEDLVHPGDPAPTRAILAGAAVPHLGTRAPVTVRVKHRDGTWRWLELQASQLTKDEDGLTGVVVACADVTDRVRVEEELEVTNGRFRSAFDDAPIGMAITSLTGQFLQVNNALCDLLGRTPSMMLAHSVQDVTHPDDVLHSERQRRALTRGAQDTHQHETRFLHSDGTVVGILHSSSVVRDAQGTPTLLIDHVEDITDRQNLEARLQHQALHDTLTGLPNRALFMDRLERALASEDGSGSARVAVLFCDIDRFKTINDTFGHHVGDLVLTSIAQRIQSVLRPTDTAARLGGDELTVLCTSSSAAKAQDTADRIRAALAEPVTINEAQIPVTLSMGIALSAPGRSTAEQLLRDSDDAMYAAKGSGRNRYTLHDEAHSESIRRRLQLKAALPDAILQGELSLHYQPQIDLNTEEQVGSEALVRWHHPTLGILMPGEFIELAEEAGLMRHLGRWVLGEVMRRVALTGRRGVGARGVIWMNTSASELDDPDFAVGVEKALSQHGVPGSALGFEITESVLMTNLGRARGNLALLRSLGVQLAIDDFGTGYSSLSYIGQFPVDTIKIDSSFIAGLDSPARRRESFAVITAVISLAHSLGLTVVAEGIETQTQSMILHGLGCDQGQGYFFGKPRASGT
ncbi:EAL domain-containing protein [Arthrobacter cheniae]|uniref:EAL domain-containing protein n=1 Tax=Arthrobacter cheniae TaxID=1258888 RepID=A0A3A5MEE1_9MICC|nr:EAL domain-containing protein [Arthrobacter cheniae]RJT80008.1 EAL domain-containing protein [Arthrobacter cheniae]